MPTFATRWQNVASLRFTIIVTSIKVTKKGRKHIIQNVNFCNLHAFLDLKKVIFDLINNAIRLFHKLAKLFT